MKDNTENKESEKPEYKHLNATAIPLLDASKADRRRFVFEDKFILHDEAAEILGAFKDAYHRPRCERPIGFALLGNSNLGKTALNNRFIRDLGGDPYQFVGVHETMPLIVGKMPPRANDARISLMLARIMSLPIVSNTRSRDVLDIVLRNLRRKKTRMIIFQEFDNVLPIPKSEREIVADFLKDLTNDGIVVVVVGTEKSMDLILEEEELVTRLKPLHLHGFCVDKSFGNFLGTLESFYPFRQPSQLAQYASYFFQKTWGVTGAVVELANEAAAWAIDNDRPCINLEALTNCRYIPPAKGPEGAQQA